MKRALIVVLLVLLAVPARADLTATEKNELKKLHVGALGLDSAMDAFGQMVSDTVAAQAADSGTVTLMSTMWARALSCYNRLHRGLIYLEGVNPNPGLTTSTYVTTGKTSALGSELLPGNVTCGACSCGALKTNFDTINADTDYSTAFRALAATGSSGMVTFNAAVDAVDDGLSYADPMPAFPATTDSSMRDFGAISQTDATLTNRPFTKGPGVAMVGPHGNYVGILADMAFSFSQIDTGLTNIRDAWNYVANSETQYTSAQFTAFGQIVRRMTEILTLMRVATLAYADIPVDNTGCGQSPFHLMVSAMEGMLSKTVGLPMLFKTMADEAFDTLTEAMVTRPVGRAQFSGSAAASPAGWHQITLTPWRYSDGAQFGALEFPISRVTTLRNLRAQFALSNTPHVPPLCADAVNPTVTSIGSPTAASTIRGMVILQANVTDNIAVNNVKFFIGAQQLGLPSTVAPWSVRWDSKEIANGARTITAKAFDAAGNEGSLTVDVTVSN